ncbi:GPI mannosyltransferase [Apiospora arundinis]
MSSRQTRHTPRVEPDSGVRRKLVTAICILSLSLSTLLLLRSKWQMSNYDTKDQPSPPPWIPPSLMKRSTADAIAGDELIYRNILAFVEFTADTSDTWAARYGSESLKEASQVLRTMRDELHANARPQSSNPFGGMSGELMHLGKRGDEGNTKRRIAPRGLLEDIADKGIQAVINAAGGSLAGVGSAAGIGVGQGTVQGLKLKSADEAKAIGQQIMKENGDNGNTLSPVVVSVGSNAAAVITRSIDFSNLTGNGMIAPAARGLAIGLGNGAVNGLGLAKRPAPPNSSSIVDVAGNLGYGLSDTVASAINVQQLLNSQASSGFTQQIPAGVLGLSQGIGSGTVSGLNISQVPPPSENSTDIPSILRIFGFGLSSSVTSSIPLQNLVALIPGGTGGLTQQLPSAVLNLAQGIGNGAVTGLKIANVPPPPENTTVPAIAGTFGYGLSNSVTSNLNVNDLISKAGGSGITAQAPQIALGLGQGLGNGAVTGLKLNMVLPPNGSSAADIAGSLGYGLTQSVTSNLNLASLGSSINPKLLLDSLPQAASGLGRGLGAGVPIGLGIQPNPGPAIGQNGSMTDVGAITEDFGTGLTTGFLANGTLSKALATVGGSGLLPKVNVEAAANGLGRGLAQGATDAVTAMGGFNSLLNGNSTVPTGPVANTPVLFNDSLNGAAVGLGQGLGTGGALAAQKIFLSGALNGVTMNLTKTIRSVLPRNALPAAPATYALLDPRQMNITPVQPVQDMQLGKLNITNLVSTETLSRLVQRGLDLMTPRGFGGLALFGQSTFKQPKNFNINKVKPFLPPGTVEFTSDGHHYSLNPRRAIELAETGVLNSVNAISVDGWNFTTLFVFISLHITFGIAGLLGFIPLAMALEAGRNIVLRIQKPHVMTKSPQRANLLWFVIGFPLIILQFIFAVVATNTAPHFKSVHGILGLITTIIGFFAVLLHYLVKTRAPEEVMPPSTLATIRHATNGLLLVLSIATGLSGFALVSTITVGLTQTVFFEYAVLIGFSVALLVVPTVFVYLLDWALVYRARKMRRGMSMQEIQDEKAVVGERARTRARGRSPSSFPPMFPSAR